PYKWGGFSTLDQFDDGLLAGKYAGDRYTGKSSGSGYAVGVDCSGFVSRCWKLSRHYSTREMDDEIAVAYASWEDLKPGDAIHKEGHVRLAVDNNPNGTILAVEAAGSSTDWRVNYRTYTYVGLSDYTPRYYINMTGPSFPMAQPVLLSTTNDSKAHINWSLSSADNINGIQIQYSNDGVGWESMLGDSLISPTVREFSYEWTNGPYFIRLKSINNEDGIVESLPSDVYGYYALPACAGKVLIVDGFDRSDGSWGLPYHAFAQWMGEILAELKVPFETVANEAVVSGDVRLLDYQAVYWILGDESTVDETFSINEQNLVAAYLKSGGQLFVSGSEIAWDLDEKGGMNDKSFFLNYLHADYVQDDANDYTVSGANGGIFSGLAFEFDDGTAGIYQEDYPDVISPKLNAIACLEYSSGVTAGIQYEGTFSDGSIPGKLVYMGFPWETITNTVSRKAVLKKISEWFGFTCAGIDPETPLIPEKPTLSHGFPNPFNSQATFKLIVPNQEPFDVFIYNSQGRVVRRIKRPESGKSEYYLSWDGRNDFGQTVASGCYFFQVALSKRVLTEKIIFLK
ncbi:MAG: T9SS type A sorting domain-containing protein, partial [Candidatus Marinimicrobia bacterium]|nr:T9SS type A sorting domain-containing protein [Candidatus Neomarinimicrobiota bacterium]